MTPQVIDLAAARTRRAEEAAARGAAKAAAIAKAQPQARACSLAPLEPVGQPAAFVEKPADVESEPIRWKISARGNPWTRIGRAHIVIFPSRQTEGEWCVRVAYDDHAGRFLKRTWPSAEDTKQWVEANAHTVTR
jgi:hypothetical protein